MMQGCICGPRSSDPEDIDIRPDCPVHGHVDCVPPVSHPIPPGSTQQLTRGSRQMPPRPPRKRPAGPARIVPSVPREPDIKETTIGVGDFACVPVRGPAGVMIGIGEWLNGAGGRRLPAYDHALIYDGWWDHTPPGVTVGEPGGRGHYVFEAQPGGARRRLLCRPDATLYRPEEYIGSLWSTNLWQVTSIQRTFIQTEVDSLLGTPYSGLDYLALAAHRLHLPIPGLQDYVADTGHLICSQLVDMIWCRAGIHLFEDNRWAGYVTPWDLARLIQRRQARENC